MRQFCVAEVFGGCDGDGHGFVVGQREVDAVDAEFFGSAGDGTFRVRSLGVKTRRTKAGVSVTIRSNRSMLTVSTPIPIIMSCTFYGRGGNRVLFAVSLILSLARFVSFRWDSVKYDA